METRENIERGMPPEEARAAALRKFGNLARVAEETRAVWQWTWAERLAQDVRYAVRGLRRNPVFTAVAVLTLALGIGMNTAVFSVVNAALIKPLPYPDSERIVWLANSDRRVHREVASAPDFADWREQAHSFEAMAGYMTRDSTIQDGDQSAKHSLVSTTPEFWRIAGVAAGGRPALCRRRAQCGGADLADVPAAVWRRCRRGRTSGAGGWSAGYDYRSIAGGVPIPAAPGID